MQCHCQGSSSLPISHLWSPFALQWAQVWVTAASAQAAGEEEEISSYLQTVAWECYLVVNASSHYVPLFYFDSEKRSNAPL